MPDYRYSSTFFLALHLLSACKTFFRNPFVPALPRFVFRDVRDGSAPQTVLKVVFSKTSQTDGVNQLGAASKEQAVQQVVFSTPESGEQSATLQERPLIGRCSKAADVQQFVCWCTCSTGKAVNAAA